MFQEFDLPLDAVRDTLNLIPDDELLRDAFAGYTSYDGTIDHCKLVEVDGKLCIRITVPVRKTKEGWEPTQISDEIQDLLNNHGEPVSVLA
jgi:hypothetical protein